MKQIIILRDNGKDYEEREVTEDMDYTRLLKHGKPAIVPARTDRESYFINMPRGISCFVSSEAGRDQAPISEWTEFLHVTGLMDGDFKCIFGDIIIECDTSETRRTLIKEIDLYLTKTTSPSLKWTHLKQLAARYGRLVACGNTDCGKPSTQHCGRCQYVMYCSRECQVKAWSLHRIECGALAANEENIHQ